MVCLGLERGGHRMEGGDEFTDLIIIFTSMKCRNLTDKKQMFDDNKRLGMVNLSSNDKYSE